jgi:hypothetical protein
MYAQMIRVELARQGRVGLDPALIEGWMRLEYGTLDALSHYRFQQEVAAAAECVEADLSASQRLALSYGLLPRRD